MELSAHQISLDPFGARTLHTRHPQDMGLGSRVSHSSQPVFPSSSSTPSPPQYAPKREASGRDESIAGSPCHSSSRPISISKATSGGVKQSPKPHGGALGGVVGERSAAPAPAKKRIRALDDVDGPGTAKLSVKKRRLLLRLVTSRLSRPFSLPATNILIRESSDNMPVLHRIQHCVGARRAGHQSSLIRKAAILNRVRIGVRTAAISRGHVIMADLAARGSALNHGLLVVTTPAPAMFPSGTTVAKGSGSGIGNGSVPPAWRPHTKNFHPPPVVHRQDYPQQQNSSSSLGGVEMMNRFDSRCASGAHHQGDRYTTYDYSTPAAHTRTTSPHREEPNPPEPRRQLPPSPRRAPSIPPPPAADVVSDEEDYTAFPSASFQDRYADLSDDDMDDVYADFGVLFGSGSRSPEARAVGTPAEEQFFEEYLDELDGIPWVM
ncbi:hypothetical protein FHL15_007816 [Xylaria flabelliformis]|uniref:Uncharacterized protein n=1 Tax=Xylaria flabelliformis TaxID=2512241 RepID=A0A553HTE6_9PEZI|nr:hypothetical protein FHL15_007816 [Xylaria flabelliformis]